MSLPRDVIEVVRAIDEDCRVMAALIAARQGMLGSMDPEVLAFWGPATPVASKARVRKIPNIAWDYSEFDAKLRRRILDLEYPGQDVIDPDKPYEVEVGETHVTIRQEG